MDDVTSGRITIIEGLMGAISGSNPPSQADRASWASLIATAAIETLIEEKGSAWVLAELRKYILDISSRSETAH